MVVLPVEVEVPQACRALGEKAVDISLYKVHGVVPRVFSSQEKIGAMAPFFVIKGLHMKVSVV